MKKFFCNRLLPLCLSIAILFSCSISANAFGVTEITEVAELIGQVVSIAKDLLDTFFEFQDRQSSPTAPNYYGYWANSFWVKGLINQNDYYKTSYEELCAYAGSMNASQVLSGGELFFFVSLIGDTSFYGIRAVGSTDTAALTWLVASDYRPIVCTSSGPTLGAVAMSVTQAKSVATYRMLSYDDLYNLAYDYNAQHNYKLALNTDGVYWAISSRGEYVLGTSDGLPYGAAGPSSVTSGGSSRPDETTNDDHIINWLDQSVGSNDGVIGFDSVIYDSNNKTYYVDNSVAIQNSFNQTYYYNWSYTYNIDYTNITYIGSSAEYTESYDCYYTLPDGRSSADLTKEDLEQLNLSMDVVPYIRSADDTRLRSLYHFDGNTEDSSYWNYATSFVWNSGASLTYLESNAFNGCLYLDELAHDFSITLPSSLGSGDFTVDFRYYQSSTLAPQNDSYISIGGVEVLRLDGSHFVFNGSNYNTPVGSWNHLAFVRKDGTLYFFLNGVQQGSISSSFVLSSVIQFHFGTSQQTYKYLDELRVTNFAVWHANFTPPTVPYDTNLSLVLPTDTVPIADEYWVINNPDQVNLFEGYLTHNGIPQTSFLSHHIVGSPTGYDSTKGFSVSSYDKSASYYPHWGVWDAMTSTLTGDSMFSLSIHQTGYSSHSVDSSDVIINGGAGWYSLPSGGIHSILYFDTTSYFSSGTYTLSIVDEFGNLNSFTFSVPPLSDFSSNSHDYTYFDQTLNHFRVRLRSRPYTYRTGKNPYLFLQIVPDSFDIPLGIRYLELVEGDSTSLSAELVSGVAGIPADDLNTPTLAVRSDIPTTDYQIGGVRPTFAERGQVYAMVESGYITSLQQYTGYAWQQVDGRIWTGSRWIPYSSYNVITLSDMYDIADASGQSGYEYIYTETGFWSWLQKWLMQFKTDLFEKLNGLGSGSSGECKHSYSAEVISDPTCTESGSTRYTCSKCGDTYTEAVSPLGHDYVASEVVEDQYSVPDDAACPECGSFDFTHTLDADTEMYHCVCSDCDEEFDVDAEFEYGYTVYTCTRCDEEYTESNKSKSGLFEAIGDFLADGIQWIGDKLVRLVDAFSGLSDIFRNFAESVKENAGGFPTLFGQVFALIPEDLQTIIWFSLIASIIVAVWKKWFS